MRKPPLLRRIRDYYAEGFPQRSEFAPGIRGNIGYAAAVFRDMPEGLRRLMRFQPFLALATGLICIFLLRAGFEYIPVVVTFLSLSLVFIFARLHLVRNTSHLLVIKISDFVVQYAIGNILLFILPFYLESTTFLSRNSLFAFLVLFLTILGNWDELYQKWVLEHPLIGAVYYGLTFFATLNFIFPVIFGMRNIWSLALSGALSVLIVLFFVYPKALLFKEKRLTIYVIAATAIILSAIWFGRSFIPPAPLKLTRATSCAGIGDKEPKESFRSVEEAELDWAYFFTAVFAPLGLSEGLRHIWYYDGKKVSEIELNKIKGGRAEGYRTWSRHKLREGTGKYRIEVWTEGGQLLGEGGFEVVKASPPIEKK